MTLTLDDAQDLWITILERHKADDQWAERATADFVREMEGRGHSKQNALVLLNKLVGDIVEHQDRTGTNPN